MDNYLEYVKMNWIQKLNYRVKAFFVGLFSGFFGFLKAIPAGIAAFFLGIFGKLKFLVQTFKEGDIKTKLSFVVMGSSNLLRGQIVKGLLFLASEVVFLNYMITKGVTALKGFTTLGTQTQHIEAKPGQVPVLVPGDNSTLMLLFGVLAIIIVITFIGIYSMNISSAIATQRIYEKKGKVPSFKEELKEFSDSKFHITLLTLPTIGVVTFTIIPIIFMILMSFTNFDNAHQPPGNLFHWVGLANYKTIFTSKESIGQTFWPVLGWTMVWAVVATGSNYILGMLLAILINKKGVRFKALYRTIFILTIAIPNFISLLIMRNMLDDNGPINGVLQQLGLINHYIPFLTNATWARASVIVVNLWIGIPYTMLITTGILLNIPEDLYEAAKIDGASPVAMYFKITLPYILFVTTPYLITQFVGNINNFNVIYLLTGGGPNPLNYYQAGKTDLLITWLYKLTLNNNDNSYASAIGFIVFILCIIFALTAYRNTASYKNEEAFQ